LVTDAKGIEKIEKLVARLPKDRLIQRAKLKKTRVIVMLSWFFTKREGHTQNRPAAFLRLKWW